MNTSFQLLTLLLLFVSQSLQYDGICNLDSSLVNEIASYEGVANQIINYVVEGEFKGKTYDE